MLATPRFPLLPIALSQRPEPEIVIVSAATGDSYQ